MFFEARYPECMDWHFVCWGRKDDVGLGASVQFMEGKREVLCASRNVVDL